MVSYEGDTHDGVLFLSRPSPATGMERDDNKFFTSDMAAPGVTLFNMNVHSIPDRDYLIRYPQGLWSGKSLESDADFRHIRGFGGQNPPTDQDMKVVAELATNYITYTSHIPNATLAMREIETSGPIYADPYTSGGTRFAGREQERIGDRAYRAGSLHARIGDHPSIARMRKHAEVLGAKLKTLDRLSHGGTYC